MIRHFVDLCNAKWKQAWRAGTMLTVDETMIGYTGAGMQHQTYLPRKPIPQGFMFKTCTDTFSRVLLHAEIGEDTF